MSTLGGPAAAWSSGMTPVMPNCDGDVWFTGTTLRASRRWTAKRTSFSVFEVRTWVSLTTRLVNVSTPEVPNPGIVEPPQANGSVNVCGSLKIDTNREL